MIMSTSKKIVLYIDSMMRGGAQRVMSVLADDLVKKGYCVILVNDVQLDQNVEYKLNNMIRRIIIKSESKNSIINNLQRIIKLRRIIYNEKPNVILSFLGPTNIRMLISSIGTHVRKIVSVRNDPNQEYGIKFKKLFANIVFMLSDGCVFQTEEASLYFRKAIRNKSTIIFNPVDEKFYNENWNCIREDIVVVGRLQEQKNPILAIKAFNNIAMEFPELRLVYYGEGELKNSIKKYASENNLEDRVVFYGNTTEISRKLSESRIFLMTSNFEGMPNALMEAMTVGIPVISSNCPCGGPRMLITNNHEGVLVECKNVKEFSNALRNVLSDTVYQEKLHNGERKRSEIFKTNLVLRQWEKYLFK